MAKPSNLLLEMATQLIKEALKGLDSPSEPLKAFVSDVVARIPLLSRLKDLPPERRFCPHCMVGVLWGHWRPELRGHYEHVAAEMKLVKAFCRNSLEYGLGDRALWQCTNPDCREMEVR